jgi:hypothetical protein
MITISNIITVLSFLSPLLSSSPLLLFGSSGHNSGSGVWCFDDEMSVTWLFSEPAQNLSKTVTISGD